MGMLDQVIGGLLGSQGDGRNSAIGTALKELLAPDGQRSSARDRVDSRNRPQNRGGFEGLLDRFARAGEGDIAESWIRPGQNRPITPQQLEHALEPDTIEDLSRRTGLPRDELLRQLSQYLPSAVDRLTPQGRRPSSEDMGHW